MIIIIVIMMIIQGMHPLQNVETCKIKKKRPRRSEDGTFELDKWRTEGNFSWGCMECWNNSWWGSTLSTCYVIIIYSNIDLSLILLFNFV